MPKAKTKYSKSWLEKKDGNGHIVGQWLKEEDSPYSAKCTLCVRSIKCDNSGFKQILAHADRDEHKAIAHQRFSKDQIRFSTSEKPGTIVLPARSHNDQVAVAEAAWSMKVAASNYSYNSCDGLSQLFQFMFPCPYTKDFSLGRSKVSYTISDGLGPYFLQLLCKSVRDDKNPFTLQFDETVTAQNQKQLDLMLRVWSENKGEVITRFLKALMFGHAKGKDVSEAILSTMNELGLNKEQFLSVGSDDPNVNKTIWRHLDEHLKSLQLPGLVDFMPCNVHVVHNGFKHALSTTYGQEAEQLALDIFY
ncbi:QTRT1 (predicted) [Pycnogonum litorale]